jgi:hypothetical protein
MKKITEERILPLFTFSYEASKKNGTPLIDRETRKLLSIGELFQRAQRIFSEELTKS